MNKQNEDGKNFGTLCKDPALIWHTTPDINSNKIDPKSKFKFPKISPQTNNQSHWISAFEFQSKRPIESQKREVTLQL
jgi:hypothetical protein